MKCPSKNFSPCYSVSPADTEGGCSHHPTTSFIRAENWWSTCWAGWGSLCSVCQKVAHWWVSLLRILENLAGPSIFQSIGEVWASPFHPTPGLEKTFQKLLSLREQLELLESALG